MGFLDRAIKNGVGRAVSNAVEDSVRKIVAPKVEEVAANTVNSAARQVNEAVGTNQSSMAQPTQSTVSSDELNQSLNTLGSFFGSFEKAATDYANEAAKNMKICSSCGETATADQKFCPSCGAELPEMTVAQGAICSACGAQNKIDTKFCASCGAKLLSTIANEEKFLKDWDTMLPQYPKWNLGGSDPCIEKSDNDEYGNPTYYVHINNTSSAAVKEYQALLKQNGFKRPDYYSVDDDLYKTIDGKNYSVNFSDPFPCDAGEMSLWFRLFYLRVEKKEEPKSALSGLFNMFK